MTTTTNHDKSAAPPSEQQPLPLHAIQLVDLRVAEISLRANLDVRKTEAPGEFQFEAGHTKYQTDSKRILVKVSAKMGDVDDGVSPFALRVELIGTFVVDSSRFREEHVPQWAQTNAPLVLYPYLREQVYGVTSRAGFSATVLPLLQIPTFRVITQADGNTKVITSREGSND
ncbi:protein-export chaperone SecB [Burkholderia glumae]|uniref:protein-export chaperone SecB n=1 Tax=Burkholderia glumae TaxID=337 RepID=UPI002036D0D7|nr:protein-export chaperone SecB [Burkholderia glumae]MCM2546224.1 protein-export chaperone SecB [Burkholderia glumae]